MARSGFPIVLSAPSGTGKTTLAHLLVDSMSKLQISISYTTRNARGSEEEGVDYHFIDDATFDSMVHSGDFLEHANVHGKRYGSSRALTEGKLAEGVDIIFDIDVQGGLQIKKQLPNTVLIYILPPSLDELDKRLRGRGTETEEKVQARMLAAQEEIRLGLTHYDYVINNEKLDRALFDLTAIVRCHRLGSIDREKIRKRLLVD